MRKISKGDIVLKNKFQVLVQKISGIQFGTTNAINKHLRSEILYTHNKNF